MRIDLPPEIAGLVRSAPRERIPPRPEDMRPAVSVEAARSAFDDTVLVPDTDAAWEVEPGPQWHAVTVVRRWLDTGRRGLLLRGGVGTGKSYAAAYAARCWILAGHHVTWLRPDQLVTAVMHRYSDEAKAVHRHVVIDDVGMERKADFSDALCDLLDRPRVTIVATTNLSRDQFSSRYEDVRLRDRMNAAFVAVDVRGKSMRRGDGGVF